MNHIYKTVWNATLGNWTAVQETAKSRGKSGSSKASRAGEQTVGVRFAFTLMASALLLASGQVMAVTGEGSTTGNSNYCFYDETSQTVICGDGTTTSVDNVAGKPAKSVVLGMGASNTGESNVAIGLKSASAETASVAIGSEAKALHNQSVAIGQNAEAHADWDISIGRRAGASTVSPAPEGRNIAIGDGALEKAVSPNNNIAMGTSAGAELTGNANVILGTYANSKTANNEINGVNSGVTANNVVAIGDRALATTNSAVAIGNRVKASGAIATAVGASANASGAYSISNGYGATSSGSHSIAIGSAQNQTNKTQATNSFAIAIGSNQTSATGNSAIAIGTEAKAAGLNSVSVGKLAGHVAGDATVAQLSQTVNIGHRAGVGVKRNIHGIAIGNGAGEAVDSPSGQNIALGNAAGSRVKGNTNVAISARAGQDVEGHDNFAALVDAGQNIKGNNNIAIGKNAGRGTNAAAPLEVSNTIAMGFEAQGSHNDTIALGQKAKAQVEDSIAIGRGVTTELLAGDTAGNREGMIAIGSETTKASGKAAVAIGRNSQGIGRGTVALGDASKSLAGQGIAVGAQANVDAAAAGGVAIGSVAKSQGVLAVALGSQAEASAARSVAVGVLSQATRAALTPNAATSDAATAAANQVYALDQASNADKTAISATVKGNLGAVSVGNATNTRQIINVAAGSEDSDAVNVAQLKAVANQITNAAGTHYYSVKDQAGDAAQPNSNYNNDGATGDRSLAAGIHSRATANNATAVGGKHAKATAVQALALGSDTLASGNSSIAIGGDDLDHLKQTSRDYYNTLTGDTINVGTYTDTTANADASIALGVQTQATGDLSTALGTKSEATALAATAVGTGAKSQAEGAVAVGAGSLAQAGGDLSVAVGTKAETTAEGAVAVGTAANASKEKAVALGAGSTTDANATPETTATVGGITYSGFAGAANVMPGHQVSVGKAGLERQIKHVAPGAISATSTDAINGSQLHATQTAIGKLAASTATHLGGGAAVQADGSISAPTYTINGNNYNNVGAALQAAAASGGAGGTHYYSVNDNGTPKGNHDNDGATADRALAAGVNASATAFGATAVGNQAVASNIEAVAVGTRAAASNTATVAIGEGTKASGTSAIAIGLNTEASGNNSFVMGSGSTATPANRLAKASGEQAVAIGYQTQSLATNTTALGANATANLINATALGTGSTAAGATSLAVGSSANATGASSVAIGRVSKSYTGNDIAIGSEAEAGVSAPGAGSSNAIAMGRAAKATQTSTVAIGNGAKAEATNSIALGTTASVNNAGAGSIAVGSRSSANGVNATAIGQASEAAGQNAFAGGQDSHAVGKSSVAVGDGARSSEDSASAVGAYTKATGAGAGAFGYNANASAYHGLALGANSAASAGSSVAIGSGANASLGHGVALGSLSKTEVNVGVEGADPLSAGGAKDNPTWTSTRAAVSVGDVGANITRQITGVAAGTNDTDAVNVAQLNTVANHTKNVGDTIVSVLGGDAAITPQGNISMSDIGGTGKGNIHDAIAAATTKVKSDDKSVTVNHDAASNTYDLAVNADGATITKDPATGALKANTTPLTVADGKVTAPAAGSADAGKLATAGDIANAINNSGFTLTAQGANGSLVKPGATVDLKNTDGNIVISKAAGNNDVTFGLADTVKIGPSTGGSPITINGTAGSISGLSSNLPQTTSAAPTPTVAEAAPANPATGNAATVGDVLNAGWNLQGNGAAKDFVRAYDTVNFVDGQGTKVTVDSNGSTSTIKVDVDAQGLAESARLPVVYTNEAGDKLYRHTNGDFYTQPNGGGVRVDPPDVIASMQGPTGLTTTAPLRLAHVAAGKQGTDAVNVNQLRESAPFAYVNEAGDILTRSVDPATGDVVFTKADGTPYAGNDISISALNPIDAAQTSVSTTVGNVAAGKKNDDAVNVSQLKGAAAALGGGAGINPDGSFKAPSYTINKTDGTQYAPANNVGDALSNLNAEVVKPLTFAGDTGANVTRKLGSTLNVKGGAAGTLTDGNIGVEANGSDTLTVKLAEKIDLGNNGSVKTGDTTVNNAGVTIANAADPSKNVSLSGSGLNNGGNKITNVAPGTDPNDAVNFSQLQAVGNAAKTHYYSVNDAGVQGGNYNNDGATGGNALAAGVGALAKQNNSIAIGKDAKTDGNPTAASGSVAIGYGAAAAGDLGLAIGSGATVTGDDGAPGGIAIGAAAMSKNGGMAIGSGADTGNGTQLIPGMPVRLNNNVALGDSARVKNDTNFRVALGSMSIAEADLTTDAYKPTAGATIAGIAAPGVTLGEVSVGGDNTNYPGDILYRRITNVAAGAADTDAVNVSQLKAVAKASATHYYSVNSTDQGAGSNYNNDGATGSNALAAGRKAQAAGANSVAVGNEASAGHNLSVAIGHAAQTRGKHALAIGARAKAGTEGSPAGADAGSWGTAIGYNAEASGTGSPLAIGTESKTVGGESPIAIGDWATVEGTGAIAIGGKAGGGHVPGRSTYAKGVRTVALGYLAQATEQDALALGANANASLSNAVALGAGSLTSTNATQETTAIVGGITYGAAVGQPGAFAGAANVEAGDQVSVGSAGSERQIKHVAPGRIAADSTDAINGSQLHATQTVIGNVADTTAAHLGGGAAVGADGKISAPTYNVTNAAGNTVGTAASNVGAALANLNNYVNSGFDVQGNGTTQGTVSPTEKINFVNGVGTTAVVSSEANGITNITFDVNAQGLAESAQLPVVYTKADGSKVYKHSNGNFYDKPEGDPAAQQLDPANIIASMQNPDGSTTTATTLANVKAGVNATDAVNVSQLQGAAAALGGGAGVNADGTFKAPSYTISKTDGTSYAAVDNVGAALGNLNAEVVKPLTITGNTNSDTGSDGSQQTLGSTLAISGGLADASKTSSNSNIRTVITDNKVDIQLADAPTFTGTVTAPIFVAHGAQNRITIDGNTGNISGLSRNLPKTQSENTAGPGNPSNITTAQALPAGVDALASNAATVGDVLNAGWNLQGNSTAKDFVRAYDTVNFVNGNGTTVEVDSDGATSTIKVNVNAQGLAEAAQLPVVYTQADGAKVYKHSDGKFYDKPEGQTGAVEVPTANVIASMQNADGSTTAPTTLANVKAGVNDNDAVNMAQLKAVEAAADAAKTHFYSVNNTDATAGNYNNDGATGANALAAGVGATATGISATAVGHGATAGAEFAVAVGLDAQATASGAMAFGNGAQATGQDSLAHGKASKATGNFATAVGNAASAGLHATAVGNGAAASGNYATSFGTGSAATGDGSAALGNDAKASEWAAVAVGRDAQASNTAAIAIGEGARAAHEHSVALGSGSATALVDNTGRASATVGGITYSGFAADAPTSMVSVGTQGAERTITNVAAGRISATSTDAINGSQLHATQTVIGNVANSMDTILGGNATVNADGSLRMSNIGGTGKDNIHDAIAAINTTAGAGWGIGNGGAAPVGTVKPGKQVDFVAGNGSTKVDVTHDTATGNSKVTVSAAPGALQYTGTNDAAGNNTPNADQFTPTNQVTLVGAPGSTGGVTINNVAPAELSATSKQAVNGSQLHAVGSSTAAALGGTSAFDAATGKVTAGLNVGGTTHTSVQDALNAINTTAGAGWNLQANGGATSNVAPNGTVNVVDGSNTKVTLAGNTLKVDVVDAPTFTGKVTAGGGLDVSGGDGLKVASNTNVDMGNNIIHNVADGAADTDAVNVRQLRAVSGNITNITNQINAVDARVTQVDNRVTNVDNRVTQVDARVTNVDNRVTEVDNRVTNVDNRVADLTGRVDGIDTRVTDVTNLVGPNLTNPDGTKGLTVYDVAGQTRTDHTNVISALNQVKNEGTKYSHTRDNGEAPIIGPTNDSSAGALGSTAQGVNAIVEPDAENATAMGRRARVRNAAARSVAIGNEAVTGGASAVAVGDGAQALGEKSISIGTGNVVHAARSGAIGDPTTIIATATDSYSIGNNNTVNTADTFVMGNNVVTSVANSVYLGAGAAATAAPTAQTAGMASYNAQVVDGVTHHYAGGTPVGVVSVGDVGQERRVQNVAAGLVSPTSTDAINGSQLYQTNAAIGNLNNRINVNHDKAMGGIASAMASAGLPQAYLPGKSMIAMGVGAYQGRSAVAVGVSTISDNGRWIIKGSVNANNKGNVGATLGAGYQW